MVFAIWVNDLVLNICNESHYIFQFIPEMGCCVTSPFCWCSINALKTNSTHMDQLHTGHDCFMLYCKCSKFVCTCSKADVLFYQYPVIYNKKINLNYPRRVCNVFEYKICIKSLEIVIIRSIAELARYSSPIPIVQGDELAYMKGLNRTSHE